MHLKVSKYDPSQRLRRELASLEWMSVGDIGRRFAGRVLTAGEYTRVERSYVAFGMTVLALQGGVARILEIEGSSRDWNQARRQASTGGLDALVTTSVPKLDEPLTPQAVADVLRASLREQIWARVAIGESCEMACGYDYYLYAWGRGVGKSAKLAAESLGLFTEIQRSPWAGAGKA